MLKKLKKLLKTLKTKIKDFFPFSFLILGFLIYQLFSFKTVERVGLQEKEYTLNFLKWNILTVVKKKGKIITFLVFGCGFYQLGEFKRTFLFWHETSNNELDILEGDAK